MMNAIVSKSATPLNLVNPEISPDVAAVVARAMRKMPEDRYQSFEEMEAEFELAMTSPKGSSHKLQPGTSSVVAKNAQETTRRNMALPVQTDVRRSGQDASADDEAKPWKRGPAKFFALTNSIPLVKNVGQISLTVVDPVAIYARNGKLAVADNASKTIKLYGANGKIEAETRCSATNRIGSKTNGGLFTNASGVTIDVLGKIYATDADDNFVRVYDAAGWFIREFQNKQTVTGGLTGLLIDDRDGCAYLADPNNGCVHLVRSDMGTWLSKFGSKGSGEGQMQVPLRMALDGFGQLYVLDQEACKISVFAKTGSFQRSWGGKGDEKSKFRMPRGLSIDQADRLYVPDSQNNRVTVFSSAGDYLFVFGGAGTTPGQFNTPVDLSVDLKKDKLYVLDKGNRRIQIFDILMEVPK
jgi:DNA-binding beta-propeller fold protein YncE